MSTDTLLGTDAWHGRVYSGGWVVSHAGDTEDVEPATGAVLGRTGVADAHQLASDSGYGLSLSILTRDVMKGLALADRIPSGIVHINDQTVNDEAVAPFGGVLDSGTGARFGGAANLDAFTDQRWITV
jgi:benzaldehyde dehydrogenase (NAD)